MSGQPQFREWFAGLDDDGQAGALARLGKWLSLHGRSTYVPGTEDVEHPRALRRLHEAEHRIFDQLSAILDKRVDRYPSEVFAEILMDHVAAVPLTEAAMLRELGIEE